MRARDDRSGYRGQHNGCNSGQRVMTDDDLGGKKGPREGGIERGRDRRRHTAAQKIDYQRPVEMQRAGKPRTYGRPEMHHRAFATHRRANTDRGNIDQGPT